MVTVESKKSKSSKLKPAVVADYNNTMGGVDKADHCLSYYPVARNQQRKYYKKIFRYLLSQAVWNAFVIFKKNGGKMRQVEFRMKLIERLIEVTVCNPSTRRGPFLKSEENVVRLTGRHFPSYVDESESRKKSRNDSDEDNLIETSSEDELSSSEDESENESLESARNWCGVDVSLLTPAPPKFPFTGNPGIKVSLR
ncbi:hypothetical protein AVEN_82480-1 [Araneus ventricosus]|uniref:PiggyBac transposable element-derived protein domain-containing protein n=1 Tax=Araneus ventricosus TaxID=182803 RepID=A0A4Y2KU08_ARAVE|nr:hypothetical protein AVEN_82480-1 [Araneus ventricosus]